MLLRRLIILGVILCVFSIVIILPIYIISSIASSAQDEFVAKANAKQTTFLIDGVNIPGLTNDDHHSFCVVAYEEFERKTIRGADDVIPFKYTIEPYQVKLAPTKANIEKEKNKIPQKMVLIWVCIRNEDDNSLSNNPGYVTLHGKKDYDYESIAYTNLERAKRTPLINTVYYQQSCEFVVPFAVDYDEDVATMTVDYRPSLFTPKVTLPVANYVGRNI